MKVSIPFISGQVVIEPVKETRLAQLCFNPLYIGSSRNVPCSGYRANRIGFNPLYIGSSRNFTHSYTVLSVRFQSPLYRVKL